MKQLNQTQIKALKEYVSLGQTSLNQGESLTSVVESIHYILNMNNIKISKSIIKVALAWDVLEWNIQQSRK